MNMRRAVERIEQHVQFSYKMKTKEIGVYISPKCYCPTLSFLCVCPAASQRFFQPMRGCLFFLALLPFRAPYEI